MSILIENVTKYFGNNLVLDNINLEIKTGSLVALLGGSGSGKSTLLRVVAGFEEPSTGRVWLNGKDCSSLSIQDKEIGFVFQTYALFQHLTVYENIAFGLSANNSFFALRFDNCINLVRNWFSKSHSFISMLKTGTVRKNQPSQHNTNKKINTYNSNLTQRLPNLEQTFSSSVSSLPIKQPIPLRQRDQIKKTLVNKTPNLESTFNKTVNFQINKKQTAIFSKTLETKKILNIFNPWKFSFRANSRKEEEYTSSPTKKDYSDVFSTQSISTGQVNEKQSYWHRQLSSNSSLRSVEELLRLVGLEELANRYPNQLSGGQCQRVALARALAVQPKVLLLDEPFGALDPKVRKNLRRWLRHLHERVGVTTLFVTHDHQEAMEVANEIVVLDKGRVKHSLNSPQKIFSRLTNGMTRFSPSV